MKACLTFLRSLLCVAVVFCGVSVSAQDQISLNFRDTEIKVVLDTVGKHTGKTFLLDPRVKGKVNILSSRPVSSALVYEILLSTLRLHGYAAVEDGDVVKIVPEAAAKQDAGKVFADEPGTGGDIIVTQVYPLVFVSANDLLPVLKPLISANNAILSFAETNTLVITDYAGNIERIDKIIRSVDVPDEGIVEIISLRHISPREFLEVFNGLYLTKTGTASSPATRDDSGAAVGDRSSFVIVPHNESNSLIVRAIDFHFIDMVTGLAEKIDLPSRKDESARVVTLRYADASKVAEILNKMISARLKQATASAREIDSPAVAIGIHPDDTTNSLVISAPYSVYKVLQDVIGKLDIKRDQVYVEALIAEVMSDRIAEFGMQWQSLRGFDANRAPSVTGVAGANLGPQAGMIGNVTGSVSSNAGLGAGFNIGIVSGSLTLADGTVLPNILALAHALETDVNANILSTPTLLTLDNEEARIVVGQNVPFITGSYAPSTGGATDSVNPFQTIERQDIGVTLKIKPRIFDKDTVKLNIYQEVSSLVPATVNTGASDVVTNKRSVESTVLVTDGQLIALGGLIQDNVTQNENKVPLLGDIPIIKHFFRYENRKQVKTNLMIFLKPHIIRNVRDSGPITVSRYEYIVDEQGKMALKPHLILPEIKSPSMPELRPEDVGGATSDKGAPRE